MAATSTSDPAPSADERTDRTVLWDDGADTIRDLQRIRSSYDNFLRTAEDASDTTFSEAESDVYRREILEQLGAFAGAPDGPSRETLHRELDTAYRAALDFADADPAVRRDYRERHPDRYEALLTAAPSPIHVDDELLMSEFSPSGGTLYKLTAAIVDRGADVLDAWVESSENVLEQAAEGPATTPDERADAADRMYQ